MSKRLFALAVTVSVALLLGACGEEAPPPAAADDILFVRSSGGGLAVMQVTGGKAGALYTGGSVPNSDWSTVVDAQAQGSETHLAGIDPATGDERWGVDIPGNLEVSVVSPDGEMAALSPQSQIHYSLGRARTKLTVANGPMGESQSFELAGNLEPEAFSTDHSSVFVISFTPPRNPVKYQVRRLDLASGTIEDVFTPHGELQGTMGGSSRVQTANPDGTRLYTLYTVEGRGNVPDQAFIHVLDLEQKWAHCIDLPAEFVPFANKATAIASSPDGSKVFVANTRTGALAELDPVGLTVARSTTIEMPFGRTRSSATADDGALYLATGSEAISVDTASLSRQEDWSFDDAITGLQVSLDGEHLYVGLPDWLERIDLTSGETESIAASGVGKIRRFGPSLEQVNIGRYEKF